MKFELKKLAMVLAMTIVVASSTACSKKDKEENPSNVVQQETQIESETEVDKDTQADKNENIDYAHLEKQIQDLPNAYITNFHGFCSLLLKKYGYLVNVMPGFTINSDPDFIKKEVLHECLEQWVLNEEYKEFFSLYFPGMNFDAFESVLLSID